MKHYLKVVLITFVILAASCLTLGAGKTNKAIEEADAVASVQIGTIKTPADSMGRVRVEKLTRCIEDVLRGVPLMDMSPQGEGVSDQSENIIPEEPLADSTEQSNIHQDRQYIVMHLRYDGGRKNTYRFYSIDDKWYMESPDGNVYGGADFITDYVQTSVNEAVRNEKVVLVSPPDGLLKLNKEFRERDWNYFFTENVYRRIAFGNSVNEAVLSAGGELRQKLILARYAVKNGYGLDEDTLQERIASWINLAESAENYDEVEAVYEAAGLTVEEDIRRSSEYYRVIFEAEILYEEVYNNFREGEDTVGETECWSVGEYWNEYVEHVINPSISQDELEEIDACLNAAEKFCEEHLL